MPKTFNYLLFTVFLLGLLSCSSRPSKVEQMRLEKERRDSITYRQAQQSLHYSDSLLQVLLPQVDPLMRKFVYSKDGKYEEHGHYVHWLLQTTSNTSRNFIQAYVSDNRIASVQSYYCGSTEHRQRLLRLSAGDVYVEKEGSNHAFQNPEWHEILTIQGDDAVQLLSFIFAHAGDRIRVESKGRQAIVYVLTDSEKQALADTYQLAVLMREIDMLERAIKVANLQTQKYEKKHINSK